MNLTYFKILTFLFLKMNSTLISIGFLSLNELNMPDSYDKQEKT